MRRRRRNRAEKRPEFGPRKTQKNTEKAAEQKFPSVSFRVFCGPRSSYETSFFVRSAFFAVFTFLGMNHKERRERKESGVGAFFFWLPGPPRQVHSCSFVCIRG